MYIIWIFIELPVVWFHTVNKMTRVVLMVGLTLLAVLYVSAEGASRVVRSPQFGGGFGQASASAQAGGFSGGFGGRPGYGGGFGGRPGYGGGYGGRPGYGGGFGGRGFGGPRRFGGGGGSISISKSISINRGPGGSQAGSSAGGFGK